MTQLILPLDHRAALGREDFLISAANAEAVAWIDRWPLWPMRTLLVYGPEGCGKSHLAQVYRAKSGAVAVSAADLDAVLNEPPIHILIEDAPPVGEGEVGLFHLINWVREMQGSLMITSQTIPHRWPLSLPDLASRVAAMTAVSIGAPDDALLRAVLVKLFQDRQLDIAESVLSFLISRMERSFAVARTLVQLIDDYALAQKKPITVPLVRHVLEYLPKMS